MCSIATVEDIGVRSSSLAASSAIIWSEHGRWSPAPDSDEK